MGAGPHDRGRVRNERRRNSSSSSRQKLTQSTYTQRVTYTNTHTFRVGHTSSVERAERDKWLKPSAAAATTLLSRLSASVGQVSGAGGGLRLRLQQRQRRRRLLSAATLKFSHKQKQILRTCAIYIAKQLSLENAARTKTVQTKGAQGSGRISPRTLALSIPRLALARVARGSSSSPGTTATVACESGSNSSSILWHSLSVSKIPRNALKATSVEPPEICFSLLLPLSSFSSPPKKQRANKKTC